MGRNTAFILILLLADLTQRASLDNGSYVLLLMKTEATVYSIKYHLIGSDETVCVIAPMPLTNYVEETLVNLSVKLFEMINFLNGDITDTTLDEQIFYCSTSEVMMHVNDIIIRYLCGIHGLVNCYRPVIKPVTTSHPESCSTSPILGSLRAWRETIAAHSRYLTPGHLRFKRSIISLFGGGNDDSVTSALEVDKRNIESLYRNEKTISRILDEVVNRTNFLSDKALLDLQATGSFLNEGILLVNFFRMVTNIRLAEHHRQNFLQVQVQSTSSLISGLDRKIQFLVSEDRNCLTQHDFASCSFGPKEFKLNYAKLIFTTGYLGTEVSLGKRHRLVCTPIKEGVFKYDGNYIVKATQENLLLSSGIVLDENVGDDLFVKDNVNSLEMNDCFYRLCLRNEDDVFLISCKYETFFKIEESLTKVKAYEMLNINTNQFPISQGNDVVKLDVLYDKLKRRSLSYKQIFESGNLYTPSEIPAEMYMEILNSRYRDKLSHLSNTTGWSFVDLIENKTSVKYYFGISLAVLILLILGLIAYCLLKRRWKQMRRARRQILKEAEQKNNLLGNKNELPARGPRSSGPRRFNPDSSK